MEDKSSQARVHFRVYGEVQNVGFRYFIHRKASSAGIFGWVKNLEDGSVEAVFEGEKAVVNSVVEDCKKGPKLAKIEKVDIQSEAPTGEFTGFEVR